MGKKLTLVVEDNPADAYLIERVLKRDGFAGRVETVNSGYYAIEYLVGGGRYGAREKYPIPDLILLDVTLPVVNGLEVLAWIKAQAELREIPVFMVTSSEDPEHEVRARQLGANGFVRKNGELRELVSAVRAHFDGGWSS